MIPATPAPQVVFAHYRRSPVAIPESFRDPWAKDHEREEVAELEEMARWVMALFGGRIDR